MRKINLHKLIENTTRRVDIRKSNIKIEIEHIKKTKTKITLKKQIQEIIVRKK